MRFAADEWLWGVLFSLVLAAILVAQGLRLARDRKKFASEERIADLLTARTGLRRTIAGVLSCLGVAFAFVAAAQPQYGKGTRILPATNLDVVVVLDYSKSMYARDVSPSRIGRAKVEVSKLIRQLGGARFAAVAFAGESISFPLTSDGSAIAQFFRGMEPNHLPVGGTAIARALEEGRQLLERDPLSRNHERVMILVTDGEDLEGDPVQVAESARAAGIRVDVVQIGGQSPEPIPFIDENGVQKGLRKDASGGILTTQLSPEGEAQLASVAQKGGGRLVKATTGATGIGEMTKELRTLMSEELSERVETVFAEVYYYPLGLAVLLLLIETFIGSAPKRVTRREPPKGRNKKRKPRRLQASAALLALLSVGCAEFDSLFERESPVVNEAIRLLQEDKDPDKASEKLIEYLETGPCEEGVIGAGDRARALPNASFDLGLSLAAVARAEKGPTAPTGGLPVDPAAPAQEDTSTPFINCAVRVLATVSGNPDNTADVRARAYYLAGNLELIREDYESAVTAYDLAVAFAPAVTEKQSKKEPFASLDTDQPLGRFIAYNRALALRLQQEKEQQEEEEDNQSNQDESEDSEQDESEENESEDQDESEENESEEDKSEDQDESEENESEDQDESDGQDESEEDQQDGGGEDSQDETEEEQDPKESDGQPEEEQGQDGQTPPPPSEASEDSPSEARDQRMLDLLEQAPTLQQHNAEQRKGRAGRATMEDK